MKAGEMFAMAMGLVAAGIALFLSAPIPVLAHCDTLDGPVVVDARTALQKGEVTPVLKWVRKEAEGEIRSAFARTLAVRKLGTEAADLADRWFFETLVRIHREGEGAPYTGLKPAGTMVEPGIAAADRALEKGTVEDLVKVMTVQVAGGIRDRYARVAERKKTADKSVQAGREYVEAYVEFIHYVERLQEDSTKPAGHHTGGETTHEGHAAGEKAQSPPEHAH